MDLHYAGEVKQYKPFTKWAKAIAARPRPAIDPLAKHKGSSMAAAPGSSQALVASIRAKVCPSKRPLQGWDFCKGFKV